MDVKNCLNFQKRRILKQLTNSEISKYTKVADHYRLMIYLLIGEALVVYFLICYDKSWLEYWPFLCLILLFLDTIVQIYRKRFCNTCDEKMQIVKVDSKYYHICDNCKTVISTFVQNTDI